MTDLTAYIELAGKADLVLKLHDRGWCSIEDKDLASLCDAIRSLVERVRELEEATEAENARLKRILGNFMYAYGPHENLGGLPGVKQIWAEARAALASQEASTAPKALPPIGEAGS